MVVSAVLFFRIFFFGFILFYTLVFDRKNVFNYKLLAIMMFAMMNTDGFIRLGAVLGAFYIFKQEKLDRYIYYIFGLSIIAFFITGGFSPIWAQLKGYVFRESVSAGNTGLGLHFFTVMQTVREAGHIPFETFANRISGNTVTFVIALFGYIYLLYKHRIMLFSLPLVGLGFLAYVGGLRFTIYLCGTHFSLWHCLFNYTNCCKNAYAEVKSFKHDCFYFTGAVSKLQTYRGI